MVMQVCNHLYTRSFVTFDGKIVQFCVDCGYIFSSLHTFT